MVVSLDPYNLSSLCASDGGGGPECIGLFIRVCLCVWLSCLFIFPTNEWIQISIFFLYVFSSTPYCVAYQSVELTGIWFSETHFFLVVFFYLLCRLFCLCVLSVGIPLPSPVSFALCFLLFPLPYNSHSWRIVRDSCYRNTSDETRSFLYTPMSATPPSECILATRMNSSGKFNGLRKCHAPLVTLAIARFPGWFLLVGHFQIKCAYTQNCRPNSSLTCNLRLGASLARENEVGHGHTTTGDTRAFIYGRHECM